MAAYSRKQYSGAASPTTTTSTLTNVGPSVTLLATTGWPSLAGIPFYVAIEAGTANEENASPRLVVTLSHLHAHRTTLRLSLTRLVRLFIQYFLQMMRTKQTSS